MTFSELNLSESLLKTIKENQYSSPFPIQIEAIPAILEGKSVVGSAQTGSGKTLAFVLPILELFQRKKADRSLHLKVLILVKSRSLMKLIRALVISCLLSYCCRCLHLHPQFC